MIYSYLLDSILLYEMALPSDNDQTISVSDVYLGLVSFVYWPRVMY